MKLEKIYREIIEFDEGYILKTYQDYEVKKQEHYKANGEKCNIDEAGENMPIFRIDEPQHLKKKLEINNMTMYLDTHRVSPKEEYKDHRERVAKYRGIIQDKNAKLLKRLDRLFEKQTSFDGYSREVAASCLNQSQRNEARPTRLNRDGFFNFCSPIRRAKMAGT